MVYEGVQLLDLAGPAEVFAAASALAPKARYEISHISPTGAPATSSTGLALQGEAPSRTPRRPHMLIVPGGSRAAVEQALGDPRLMDWLASTAASAQRVASICTGAFLLGALGLLDQRRVTTHWSAAGRLAKTTPLARVDADALYIEDGPIWTSAGVSAGIDLALALVARDLGPDLALAVARELVVHLARPGGQAQASGALALQTRARGDLSRLIPWLHERLDQPLTIPVMAAAMGLSERTFQRRCREDLGIAPARLLAELRLERARGLLLEAGYPLATIAHVCGFADAMAFSKAFRKRFGVSPGQFRTGDRPKAMQTEA